MRGVGTASTGRCSLATLNALMALNLHAMARLFDSRVAVLTVRPPLVVRLDGIGFGRVLRGRPVRDPEVHGALVKGCEKLMGFFNASFCHAVSDEVNLYILRPLPYGGREFKVVSIASSILSSSVSLTLNKELYFDARVIELESLWHAIAYYLYRARVGLNNYVSKLYTELVSKECRRLGEMVEELRRRGVEVVADWRSTGTCVYVELVEKEGFNPLLGEKVTTIRRAFRTSDSIGTCLEKLVSTVKSAAKS